MANSDSTTNTNSNTLSNRPIKPTYTPDAPWSIDEVLVSWEQILAPRLMILNQRLSNPSLAVCLFCKAEFVADQLVPICNPCMQFLMVYASYTSNDPAEGLDRVQRTIDACARIDDRNHFIREAVIPACELAVKTNQFDYEAMRTAGAIALSAASGKSLEWADGYVYRRIYGLAKSCLNWTNGIFKQYEDEYSELDDLDGWKDYARERIAHNEAILAVKRLKSALIEFAGADSYNTYKMIEYAAQRAYTGLSELNVDDLWDQIEHLPLTPYALRNMPYQRYLKSMHWHSTRNAARRRAGDHCQVCNSTEPLDVHHRTYDRRGAELPDDLIVLCRKCHGLFHREGRLAR